MPIRTGCGIRSQFIGVLEAQIKRRLANADRDIPERTLTIGLDVGDLNKRYCVLDETGQIQLASAYDGESTGNRDALLHELGQ